MAQFYTNPDREHDSHSLPDAEVFYAEAGELQQEDCEPCEAGWYTWFCFPGCMPDSEPDGPHATATLAIEAHRAQHDDGGDD